MGPSPRVKKNTPMPHQFFEECENKRVRGYGTWKSTDQSAVKTFAGAEPTFTACIVRNSSGKVPWTLRVFLPVRRDKRGVITGRRDFGYSYWPMRVMVRWMAS